MENKANNEENSGGNCQEEHEDGVLFACRSLHPFLFFRPGDPNLNLAKSREVHRKFFGAYQLRIGFFSDSMISLQNILFFK